MEAAKIFEKAKWISPETVKGSRLFKDHILL